MNRGEAKLSPEEMQHRDLIEKSIWKRDPGSNGQRERRKPKELMSLRLREKDISKR